MSTPAVPEGAMSDTPAGGAAPYTFDDLPVEPIPAGSTVLVAGKQSTAAEELAVALVASAAAAAQPEGALFVSTDTGAETLLTACGRLQPTFSPEIASVVDCSGADRDDEEVATVAAPSDLGGITTRFAALYESLFDRLDDGRVRAGVVGLSSLAMHVELRSLLRFTRTVAGRVDIAAGFGAFALDPTAHHRQVGQTLGQAVDGRIEVREPPDASAADGELRVRGFRDQPREWTAFSLE